MLAFGILYFICELQIIIMIGTEALVERYVLKFHGTVKKPKAEVVMSTTPGAFIFELSAQSCNEASIT